MTENDRVLASIGLPRHRRPKAMEAQMERMLALWRSVDLELAMRHAATYSAVGWPSGTLGDGTGSRNSDTSSSVERAGDPDHPNRYANADYRMALMAAVFDKALRDLDRLAGPLVSLAGDILAHASDVDEVPAGTGACEACSKVCRPTAKDPDNRLRAGLCDPCRKHFARSGIADRGEWLLVRRAMVGHKESADEMASRFQRTYGDGSIAS